MPKQMEMLLRCRELHLLNQEADFALEPSENDETVYCEGVRIVFCMREDGDGEVEARGVAGSPYISC